jgi:hypothetical protein
MGQHDDFYHYLPVNGAAMRWGVYAWSGENCPRRPVNGYKT